MPLAENELGLRAVGLAIDERKRETTTRRLEDLEFELLFEILVANPWVAVSEATSDKGHHNQKTLNIWISSCSSKS